MSSMDAARETLTDELELVSRELAEAKLARAKIHGLTVQKEALERALRGLDPNKRKGENKGQPRLPAAPGKKEEDE